jgi:farnesyl-diphosphate farnesyltransferase
MAEGMQIFTIKKVETVEDYDLYCHYVAGLVGIGLSQMFSASGLEDDTVLASESTANHMGLFLQKANIIRDFLEDHEDVNEETGDRRVFWPKEIWGQYTDSLQNFTFGKCETQAVACLNHMVTDALRHLPYCIEYLSNIRDYHNFLFCAIPQVMAAHTLSLCYSNPNVFKGEIRKNLGECRNTKPVKIRKGLSAKLMLETTSMQNVLEIFEDVIESIAGRISPSDPSSVEMISRIQAVRDLIQQGRKGDSASCKLGENYGWDDSLKSLVSLINDFTPILILMLVLNSMMVDLPLVLGCPWWSKTILAGPCHMAITAWCIVFYSWALFCVSQGIQTGLRWLVSMHLIFTATEVLLMLTNGNEFWNMTFEAVPKCLAAVSVYCFSRKTIFRKLTPSHRLKVLKLKAL